MVNFSDENGVEMISLLNAILVELQNLNSAIEDMREIKFDGKVWSGSFGDIIDSI